jgi:F-type H+-transporting ATPase subunit b
MNGFLADPSTWVLAGFILFVLLVWKPLWNTLTSALDKRSEQIRHELEEAVKLREEAQAILADYRKKEQESLAEAERIVEQTKADAEKMAQKAEEDLKASLERRKAMALAKITQAEAKAMQMVQEHVVDIAVSAARATVQEQIDSGKADELVKLATAEIDQKLH